MTQAKRKRELGGFKGVGMVSEWRCREGFKEDKALDGRSEEREGLWRRGWREGLSRRMDHLAGEPQMVSEK